MWWVVLAGLLVIGLGIWKPSALILCLLLAVPAVVFLGWGPNRQWLWARTDEEVKAAIRFGSGIGKWIAGASGVGIVLGITLVSSAYTALEGAGDRYCQASYVAGDAIPAGLGFLRSFVLCGILGFVVAFMPEISRAYCWLRSDLGETAEGKVRAQRRFFGVQIALMIVSVWGIVLALFSLSSPLGLDQKSLYESMKMVDDICAARDKWQP